MTPQAFVDSIDVPETLRHVAIVARAPLYFVSQWMVAVRQQLGCNYDRYSFRINPLRLHGFIDGHAEPRLAITFHDLMEGQTPKTAPPAHAIIIREIEL